VVDGLTTPPPYVVLARRVYTWFNPPEVVEALVTYGDRVVYAGSREKALRIGRELNAAVLDLGDSVVVPGLIDPHIHIESLGLSLNSLDLRGVSSIEELKEVLRRAAGSGTGWIFGRGWDQERFREGRYPTRWDVDEAVGRRPAILVRVCGHMALLSTAAAEELDVERRVGGRAIRDSSGSFTGLVIEEGVGEVMSEFWRRVDDATLTKYLLDALAAAARYGVTTVGVAGTSARVLSLLSRLASSGSLPLRVRLYLDRGTFDRVAEASLAGPLEVGNLRVVGVKLFADGSLGARTAYLGEPYEDEPGTRGVRLLDRGVVARYVRVAEELGYQVAVHAIGDAALDEVLAGLAGCRSRHRVEHLSVVRDDQLEALGRLGVAGVVQPHFIVSDWWVVRRVGARRARWVYRFRTLSRYVQLALSTDAPVEPIDPWENIYAAVTRGAGEGVELSRYTEGEELRVAEALHYYTYGSAYALREEGRLGSLRPGHLADFAVLDRDPLEVGIEELRRVRVLGVYVGGSRVL
jgi:predicted amidohydrolase YtcJ